jgi:hypothetical protein
MPSERFFFPALTQLSSMRQVQVKTRLQASNCAPTSTSMSISRDIFRSEGAAGLWRGTIPASARAALLTASQCVTYDVVKHGLRRATGADDSFALQVATGVPMLPPAATLAMGACTITFVQLFCTVRNVSGKEGMYVGASYVPA